MSIEALRLTDGKVWSADSIESLFELKKVHFESPLQTLNANTSGSYTPVIEQPGWIPIAFIRLHASNLTDGVGDSNVVLRGFNLFSSSTTAYVSFRNVSSSTIKVHYIFDILYIKPRFPLVIQSNA